MTATSSPRTSSRNGYGRERLKKAKRRIVGRIGAWLFKSAKWFVLRRDIEGAERIGASLGRLLFRLSPKHRKRALSNLALAYPEISKSERRALAVKVFEHFGRIAADFLWSEKRTPEVLLEGMECSGFEHVEQAVAGGKGTLILTGHFGNWERMLHLFAVKGYRGHVVARPIEDPVLQDEVWRLRELSGAGLLSRGDAARAILKGLRSNLVVGLLPDQNSDESYLPFFEMPAGTTIGPAVLAERTGAAFLPSFCFRLGPGKYRAEILPPLRPCADDPNPAESMMRQFNESLESVTRRYPEQWLWFHDRWKSARESGRL